MNMTDDEFDGYWEANESDPKNAVSLFKPETKAGLRARAIKEGVTLEKLPGWVLMIQEAHPATKKRDDLLPDGATAKDRHAHANGQILVPPATPRPLRRRTGPTVWDALEKQKAEAEAKAEKIRMTRNPWRKKP